MYKRTSSAESWLPTKSPEIEESEDDEILSASLSSLLEADFIPVYVYITILYAYIMYVSLSTFAHRLSLFFSLSHSLSLIAFSFFLSVSPSSFQRAVREREGEREGGRERRRVISLSSYFCALYLYDITTPYRFRVYIYTLIYNTPLLSILLCEERK